MKKLLVFFFVLCSYSAISQSRTSAGDYEFDGDTLFFKDKTFLPGDTLRLGFGSGTNKQFLFIIQQTSNMKKRMLGLETLPYEFSNAFLIYKRIDKFHVRGNNNLLTEPIFGMKNEVEKLEWTILLSNAFKANEIVF